jgi:predicted nucleic acid-binding protein
MKAYLLDTSALMTLRDDEAGAQTVADLLHDSINNKVNCYACFMTQMEILYRVWKDETKQEGWVAYEMLQSLPIEWIHENKELLEIAATIKATHSLSLADAWIAACALLRNAILVHKDPEFKAVDCQQLELPYSSGS